MSNYDNGNIFSNIVGNPTGSNVNDGVKIYQDNKNDGVIAFGGGSGLDVGKAIAFMSGQSLPLWDFVLHAVIILQAMRTFAPAVGKNR